MSGRGLRSAARAVRAIRIGCAGWSIPRRYRGLFEAGESVLASYATRFSAVEINSSFYRPHRTATYERWAASVPGHFRFSVKVPRAITHELGLRAASPPLERFLAESAGLGDKLGGYLLQLPPSLAFEPRVASAFFRVFRHRSDAPVACEARHPSWFTERAGALLERHGIGRVIADPAAGGSAAHTPQAYWHYWRWHGAPRIYYSPYPDDALRQLASAVMQDSGPGISAWVIFDNTAQGFATANAARLQELLAEAPATRRRKPSHA